MTSLLLGLVALVVLVPGTAWAEDPPTDTGGAITIVIPPPPPESSITITVPALPPKQTSTATTRRKPVAPANVAPAKSTRTAQPKPTPAASSLAVTRAAPSQADAPTPKPAKTVKAVTAVESQPQVALPRSRSNARRPAEQAAAREAAAERAAAKRRAVLIVERQKVSGAAFLVPAAVRVPVVDTRGVDHVPTAASLALFAGVLLVLAGMLGNLALGGVLVSTPTVVRFSLLGIVGFGMFTMLVAFFGLIVAS